MKKKFSVTNFAFGVNELNGQGASDLVNFDIQSDGALVTRQGFVGSEILDGSPVSGTVVQVFFANEKLFVQSTQGLYYRSGSNAFTALTNSTGLSSGDLQTACGSTFTVVVANNDRVFLANTAANGRFWIDTGVSVPVLYKWGIDAPSIGSFSSGSGSGPEEGEYAYAFAYEGKYGAMSPLSERRVYTHSSDGPVSITLPSASGLDAQIEKIVIYRTEKSTPVTFADGQQYEEVLAKNAPLKQIATVAKASMGSGYSDVTTSIGLAPLAGQLEGAAKPPNLLTNITLYGGRIWGCVNGTDDLVFSALDETAAPLYDIFPDEGSPIPHVVKTREKITAIAPSRDYLAVFSETSIQLVKGQGVISGIYGVSQPGTDLDLSQRLNMMGCNSHRLVDTFNDSIYFYSTNENRVYRIDQTANISWVSQPVEKLMDTMDGESGSSFVDLVADRGMVDLLRLKSTQSDILRFNQFKNQWTRHNLGANTIRRLAVNLSGLQSDGETVTTFDQGLYSLATIDGQVRMVHLFKESTVQDNGTDIVTSYTSPVFNFPKPTRLDMVRIGTVGDSTTTVYFYTDSDEVTSQVPDATSTTAYALNKNNNYTVRTFARGYKHQVKFQLTGAQTVRFFELQFRSR